MVKSSRILRYIIITAALLAVAVVVVLLLPRKIEPEKKLAEPDKNWSQIAAQAYAAPAKAVMLQIAEAANAYHATLKTWPASVDQLEGKAFIAIPDSVKRWWIFGMSGSPLKTVSATSTKDMPDGSLHPLLYTVETGKFIGYGTTPTR